MQPSSPKKKAGFSYQSILLNSVLCPPYTHEQTVYTLSIFIHWYFQAVIRSELIESLKCKPGMIMASLFKMIGEFHSVLLSEVFSAFGP